ncbi:hypothetical protein QTN47_21035 [Danxiaibacter flavus]|uniref:Uncharacterized protein n=1 Tax=Danxiaibacter flavus TaxID=3049108 RepID=A0ABV3ZJH2_9BACT|nr:hypothetical protein QNM32_21040 [Chitinophagaceae bacterium DXS]
MTDVIDKKASELSPNLLTTILQYARKAAEFPTLVRVEQHIHSLGRWFDASYVKIGEDSEANIAILFKDITQVKIYQKNQSFLSEITRDLVMLRNIRNGLDELAEKIAKHFDVPWCSFAEITDDRTTAVANYGWNADFVPSLKGIYDTEELWSREEAERMNNGQAFCCLRCF